MSIGHNSYDNSTIKKEVFPNGRNVQAQTLSEHTVPKDMVIQGLELSD